MLQTPRKQRVARVGKRHQAPAVSRALLLSWYDGAKRALPWRASRDPYAIWVSEIMCQQTRVDTVVPYFERFMTRFPTPKALAEADQDEVLSLWSGLGYYRRARLLHAGVREVVASYGGKVPEDAQARLSLPGVGRYTAGAIGSIAFGKEEPIVDGNVARVLSRHEGIEAVRGSAASERALWASAAEWVVGERPGDLNQALMELGATVCTPQAPRCTDCPIGDSCAVRDTDPERLPVIKKKKAPKPVWCVAVVATCKGRVWLERGATTLFGGMWSVPMIEVPKPQLDLLASAATRGVADHAADKPGLAGTAMTELSGRDAAWAALARSKVNARVGAQPRGEVEHVLSHRRLHVQVWRATAAKGDASEDARLVPLDELDELGVSKLTRKILAV